MKIEQTETLQRMWKLRILACAMVLMLSFVGCGPRLSSQSTIDLVPNDIRSQSVAAVNREQTIEVTAKSDGAPIDVHVYLVENETEVDRAITLGKASEKIFAFATDQSEITLSASIPAGKEAAVRLQTSGAKAAKVELSITN